VYYLATGMGVTLSSGGSSSGLYLSDRVLASGYEPSAFITEALQMCESKYIFQPVLSCLYLPVLLLVVIICKLCCYGLCSIFCYISYSTMNYVILFNI